MGTGQHPGWAIGTCVAVISVALALLNATPTMADDPSFMAHIEFASGSGPASIAVGDFNSDGKPDLAVANSRSPGGAVTIMVGDGTGSFSAPSAVTAPVANPNSVAVGDFNGDGRQDLAAMDFYGGTTSNVETYGAVMLGDGATGFAVSSVLVYAGLANPLAVRAGDVNADGASDIVTVGARSQSGGSDPIGFRAALLGDGTGGFPTRKVSTGADVARSAALSDLNGDGTLDLAIAASGREDFPGDVVALFGNGTGVFGVDAAGVTGLDAGDGATSVAAGDFNADSIPDLVTANYTSDNVTVFLGTGGGSLSPAQSFPAHDGPVAVNVGDFDGDGRQDLVVANAISRDVSVLPGSGTGTFGIASNFAVGEMFTLVASRYHGDGGRIAVSDLNCNGTDDVIVANSSAGTISVLMNARPGTKPAGCQATSPDTTAPAVKVVSTSLRMTKAGVVALKLRCPADEPSACRAKVTMTTAKKVRFAGAKKRVTLGTASTRLAPGKTSVVKVKLIGSKRTLVKRLGSVRVKVSVRTSDEAGNAAMTTKVLTARA